MFLDTCFRFRIIAAVVPVRSPPIMASIDILPTDATRFPFVGYIETSFPSPARGPGGLEIGTGTLIAPRLVLTAAHMVYDPAQGGQAVSIDITFGGPQGRKYQSVKQVDFPLEWRNPRDDLDTSLVSPVDIGVIVLPQPIDRFITPVPFQTASDTMLAGMLLNVVGYPAFPPQGPRGALWGNDFNLLQGGALPAEIRPYESFRLFYPVNTLGGMSGGPVYDFDPATTTRTVRGVHTAFLSDDVATATRIDENIFQLIQHWVTTFRP
jgi:glutamyl endopeptidase